MTKQNFISEYAYEIFITFWVLHGIFALLCVFGPLLISHLSPVQKGHQENLGGSLGFGILIVPILFLATRYIPFLVNFKWLNLAAPLSFAFSVYSAWAVFHFTPKPLEKLYFNLNETKTYQGLSIKFLRMEPHPTGESHKVGVFELKTAQNQRTITLDPYRYDEWEGYTLSLHHKYDDNDQSAIIWVRKDKDE